VSSRSFEPDSRARKRPRKSPRPLFVVLSGPSGVGKDAVLTRMRKLSRPFHYVVTATTRPRRAREKDGVNYHFLSRNTFQQMMGEHRFLEWANVYGNSYGVPKDEVSQALARGLDTIVKVDVQGAATIKKILPQAVFIFLAPPSLEALEDRLKRRRSESSQDLAVRLAKAEEEIRSLPMFDYVITSDHGKLDEVVSRIDAIVAAEKCRVKPRTVTL
jgi:guanylate kinase